MHISPQPIERDPVPRMGVVLDHSMPWSLPPMTRLPPVPRPVAVPAAKDATIVEQDDEAKYCFLVVTGCVRTVRTMTDGRRQIGEFLFAGDVYGWDVLETHEYGIEAVTPALLHRFPRDELQEFADAHSNFGRRMRELSARQGRASRDHMILLGRKTATERLASFLLALAARLKLEDGAWIAPPMSRSDIADYLGLTIETVCRQLKQLREDGAISAKGTKILIQDRQSLAGCATMVMH